MLKKTTIPAENLGAGVPGQDFEGLGVVDDRIIWEGQVAEDESNRTVDVSDINSGVRTSSNPDL